jgi:ketosteroid isomerase-like protein
MSCENYWISNQYSGEKGASMRLLSIGVMVMSILMLAIATSARPSKADLRQQVMDAERAFAATMRARDHEAFGAFVADEAVFFSGSTPVRGRAAILEAWRQFYLGPRAPFSWTPDQVEVLDSGTLAYSGGPVYDAAGRQVGRFNSIWRLEAPGRWKVVFDRGEGSCDDRSKPAAQH